MTIFNRGKNMEQDINTINTKISELGNEWIKVDGKLRVTQYLPDRKPLMEKKRKIETEREKLRQKLKLLKHKEDIEWKETNVPKILPDIRYTIEHAISLRSGIIPPHAIGNAWLKPKSTIIDIRTNTGRNVKFDLKRIRKSTWQRIIATPYGMFFFPIENVPATKKGKPVGIWRPSEYEKAKDIKPMTNPTFICIRRV